MRQIHALYLVGALLLTATVCPAQRPWEELLQEIEKNNKTLHAKQQWTKVKQLEARTGNSLANPSVEFERMWGNRNRSGAEFGMTVKQSLDFPTVYGVKNKLAALRTHTADAEMAVYRQTVLLTAQQAAIEMVFLTKQQALLAKRLANAERLAAVYQERMEKGEANQLEVNKVQLELLAVRNDSRLNEAARKAAQEQLECLNGGVTLQVLPSIYPKVDALPRVETLLQAYLEATPELRVLHEEQDIAQQSVKLSRALSLPKFDVGYKRNSEGDHVASNGFVLGISVPLLENKNKVKTAKAQAALASLTIEEARQHVRSSLLQWHEQAMALQTSLREYSELLKGQRNIELLNKALQAGEISLVDYFTELATVYDSESALLSVERDYHLILSQLYSYRL